MSRPCTLRTFWIGFKDWLLRQHQAPWQQPVVEVLDQSALFAKPVIAIALVMIALLLVGVLLQTADRQAWFLGFPVQALGKLSTALSWILIPTVITGYARNRYRQTRNFCHQMCERGWDILEGAQ